MESIGWTFDDGKCTISAFVVPNGRGEMAVFKHLPMTQKEVFQRIDSAVRDFLKTKKARERATLFKYFGWFEVLSSWRLKAIDGYLQKYGIRRIKANTASVLANIDFARRYGVGVKKRGQI